LATLLTVGFYAGQPVFAEATRTQLARLGPDLPESLALLDGAFIDPAHLDPGTLPRLDTALDTLRFTSDPVRITRIATAGAYLD
ncbi:hypothetical protein, partial [Salmonella sp. SAL4434]|uniref:hypothetical protein n=1 Tax=Salmonella sp. SAL4434 TaxID=3159889 RepID=UPI003979D0F4